MGMDEMTIPIGDAPAAALAEIRKLCTLAENVMNSDVEYDRQLLLEGLIEDIRRTVRAAR